MGCQDTKRALPGFDQGVTGMRVGGKRRFTVPSTLAYQVGTCTTPATLRASC